MTGLAHLKENYRAGRLVLFVGAGASISVSWKDKDEDVRGPSWTELVDESIRQLGFSTPELARCRGTDLQILEYFKQVNGGQTAKLTNWFARRMDPPEEVIMASPIHSEIVQMEECYRIYTTNYDDFIERAFRLSKIKYSVIAQESEMGVSGSKRQIIKFHGDLDHPDHIVMTESDYEKRLKLSTPMDFKLRADLLGSVVLFVGYSFRDPNVSYLFRLFSEHRNLYPAGSLPGQRAFIILPNPSKFERQLFQERNIEIIDVEGGDHLSTNVATVLRKIRS